MTSEQKGALPVPEVQLTSQETLGLDGLVSEAHRKALSGERLELGFDDFAKRLTGERPDIRRARSLIPVVFAEFIKHGGSVGLSERTSMLRFWLPPEARIVSPFDKVSLVPRPQIAVRDTVLAPYLPDGLRVDEEEFRYELRNLQAFGEAVREGELSLPEISQILDTPVNSPRRVKAARVLARAALLPFLERSEDPKKTVRRFGGVTRRIISVAGLDAYKKAFQGLSDLEWRLTTENLSINMLVNRVGGLDIEYCNEKRIAAYIRRVVFHPNKWIRWQALSNLMEIVAGRVEEGELDPTLIFKEYQKLYYADYLLKQLVVAAYEWGTSAELSLILTGVADENIAVCGRRLSEDEDYFAERVNVWRTQGKRYG